MGIFQSDENSKGAAEEQKEMGNLEFKYVIVGAGNAAGYAAKEFVDSGRLKAGDLCLIGSEPVLPYERPALSKGFMLGKANLPGFNTCAAAKQSNKQDWYDKHGITTMIPTTIEKIDFAKKCCLTSDNKKITYGKLLLATGASVVRLTDFKVPGADLNNIFYLRDHADGMTLRNKIEACDKANIKVVLVGGGYIGTEMAAALLSAGLKKITMVFPEDRIVSRVMVPELAAVYEGALSTKGATIMKGVMVNGFEGESGNVTKVLLKDGQKIDADMVVVGVGARPNTKIFQDELKMDQRGVQCDDQMKTSVDDVYACGDIATYPIQCHNMVARLEHVRSARATAQHAARSMLGFKQSGIDFLPVFYSRIFDFSWEMVGKMTNAALLFGVKKNEDGSMTTEKKFGCVWTGPGNSLAGVFLESGTAEEKANIAKLAREQDPIPGACLGDPEKLKRYILGVQ